MNICVCIKRVPLLGSAIVLTEDQRSIDTSRLGFTVSPHEECAVEAAVQLVEEHGGTITLLCLGPAAAVEQLREQLALGPDRAILLEAADEVEPQATAALMGAAIEADVAATGAPYDLILLGSESADTAGYQTGIRLAHRLGLPAITNVKGLAVADGQVTGERAVGSAREVYRAPLPAVVTTKDGLNVPRYPSVPGRIKARKKAIDIQQVPLPAGVPAGAPAGGMGPRMEKLRLIVPVSEAKGAQDLGTGDQAAARLVEVIRQIGVLA